MSFDLLHNGDYYSKDGKSLCTQILENAMIIIDYEMERFEKNFDCIDVKDDEYILIEETQKDGKTYKTYINRNYETDEKEHTRQFDLWYKLYTFDDINRFFHDLARDFRATLHYCKKDMKSYDVGWQEIDDNCNLIRDYRTNDVHLELRYKFIISARKWYKHYCFTKVWRKGKSRNTTHSENEEDFDVFKPKMCLFDLLYNNIDIYLNELPAHLPAIQTNKKQRIN